MEMRGLMGGFYRLSEWIMRLSVTNLLWLLTSLPFWVFLFNALFTPDAVKYWQEFIIVLAIVAPFTFFPATSAMFSVARKWVLGDTEVPLLRTFFRSYKQNFFQAMIGGILYAVLFAVLIIDYQVYLKQIAGFEVVAYLFMVLMFLLLMSLLHFFSLLSHFHMKTTQLLKNALVLTIGRPLRSILMAVGAAAVLLLSMKFTFLIPFFFGSIIAVYTFYNFNIIIQKMMLVKEAAEQAGPEEASEEGRDNQQIQS